jgi:hypothetical protein
MRVRDTNGMLFGFARHYAKSRGYEFGDGASHFLRNRAEKAELEIGNLPVDEGKLKRREAELHFEKLVDEMILARDRIAGYADSNPGVIGERTLSDSLGRLCPLWPFC